MLEFKEINLQDKKIIESYLYKYGGNSCQHSFPTMYLLKDKYHDLYCVDDGCLFVYRQGLSSDSMRVYLFPFCPQENIERAIRKILDDAADYAASVSFFTVTREAVETATRLFPGVFEVSENRDYAEYIYTSEKLAFLKGKKMAAKRNHINTFNREYHGRYEIHSFGCTDTPQEAGIIDDILHFQKEWLSAREKQDLYSELLTEDHHISTALKHRHRLNICGVALYVDHSLEGYTFGTPISPDCVDVIAEKGNIDIGGCYQVLNNAFARMAYERFTYINREEDLGVAGLRKAKLSYKPDILLAKYILSTTED